MPASRPSRLRLSLLVLAFLAVFGLDCAALGPLAPELAQVAGQGLAAVIQAEAQAKGIPDTDPAYQAALKAAQVLEKDQGAKLDSIIAEMHRQRAACAKPAAAAPSASSSSSPAPTSTPLATPPPADAGLPEAGR